MSAGDGMTTPRTVAGDDDDDAVGITLPDHLATAVHDLVDASPPTPLPNRRGRRTTCATKVTWRSRSAR